MIKRDDIIWLAGLLEGEGCFLLERKKYTRIILSMTDKDVVARVACMWKGKMNHRGNIYKAEVYGAHAISWMMTMYSLFGKRRKEKIASIIKVWRERTYTHASNGMRNMAKCHPDRVVAGLDMCGPCYGRWWRKKRSLKLAG